MAKSRKKKSSGYTQIEKLAYRMGQVKRGLSNSNSRVYESYQKGCNSKTTKQRKPLF